MQRKNSVLVVLAGMLALALLGIWLSSSRGAPASPDGPALSSVAEQAHLDVASSRPESAPRTAASRSELAALARTAGISPEELLGRVIMHDTKLGIAGAEVQVQLRDADQFWNLDLEYGEQTAVLARLHTDVEGRFRVPVQRALRHRLQVEARGYAHKLVPACVGGAETVVELVRGASLDGVVKCQGTPLVDTPIRIAVYGEGIELATGRTDASGAYRFVGLSPADALVQVQSPLHGETWKRVTLLPDGAHHLDVEVPAGTTLHGRVVDAGTRTPIAGAEVSDSWTFRRVARTGADGAFALAGLTDNGHLVMHVRAVGYARATVAVSGELAKPAEFALVRGGDVRGRCVDAAGAPLPNSYVAVGASFMESPGMQHTDWIRATVAGDGRFQAAGLRPDQHYWIYVRLARHGTRSYALPRPLAAGESLEFGDIVLRPSGGVEGRVVDENGEPWPSMQVTLRGANADSARACGAGGAANEVSQFVSRDTTTDGSGVFRLTDVSGGTYRVSVVVRGRGRTAVTAVSVVDGALTEDVRLVVPRGLGIAGTLRFADGRPPADAASGLELYATTSSGMHVSTRVERGGRFAFTGLTAEPHTIACRGTPKGWVLAPRREVAAGTQGVELVLEPAVTVEGRVVDAKGTPIQALVWAMRDGERVGASVITTDDGGRFTIEVAADFRGSIGATDKARRLFHATREGVVAGQRDLELKVQ